jgi:hypothetical protein
VIPSREAARDASLSVMRVRPAVPQEQRKMGDELAKVYIALYSSEETDD